VNVLYVNHTGRVSGAERSLLDLLRGLPPEVQPTLATPEGRLAEVARASAVPVRIIQGTDASLKLHPMYTPGAVGQLSLAAAQVWRLARQLGTDVVHANSIRAGMLTALARRAGGPPLITHVRDRLPEGRTSRIALEFVARGADLVLANSAYTARSLPTGRGRAPVQVVYSPVDLARFAEVPARADARQQLGLPEAGAVLAVIAQITPWKGQAEAIEALALLTADGVDARLLIVGDATFDSRATRYDNRAYLDALRHRSRAADVNARVIFTGASEDIPGILAATDVLLAPSWEEPFGRSVVEGMAAGLPVVATSNGGPAEIIEDGVTGTLLRPRRPDEWALAIGRLLVDDDRRAAMGRRARAAVLERFTPHHHVAALLEAYERVRHRPVRPAAPRPVKPPRAGESH
jgi:glycosyltransferase involved in cell wall biosynthesis